MENNEVVITHTLYDVSGAVALKFEAPTLREGLQHLVLTGVDLSGIVLTDQDLRGIILLGAKMNNCRVEDCLLDGAVMPGACLEGAVIKKSSFRGADLRGIDAPLSRWEGVNCAGADASGGDFYNSYMGDVSWRGAKLDGASMVGVDKDDTNTSGASCFGVAA